MAKPKTKRAPRTIRTQRFIEAHPDAPGALLYVAAVDAAIPLSVAAEAGGVSRYSAYLWACGDVTPRPAQVTILRRLTNALRTAIKAGELPTHAMSSPEDLVALIRRYL